MRAHAQVYLSDADKIIPCEPLPAGRLRVKVIDADGGMTLEITGTREVLLALARAVLALTPTPEEFDAPSD